MKSLTVLFLSLLCLLNVNCAQGGSSKQDSRVADTVWHNAQNTRTISIPNDAPQDVACDNATIPSRCFKTSATTMRVCEFRAYELQNPYQYCEEFYR